MSDHRYCNAPLQVFSKLTSYQYVFYHSLFSTPFVDTYIWINVVFHYNHEPNSLELELTIAIKILFEIKLITECRYKMQ